MPVRYHENQFPPKLKLNNNIQRLLGEARTELGRYNGLLSAMLDSDTLLSPLLYHEAVMSSKIEGIPSTLTDVLAFAGGSNKLSESKRNDLIDVLNCRDAYIVATDCLMGIPLSQRLLKKAHYRLMQGISSQNKSPGTYRKIPVWVGSATSSIETARFVPIEAQHIETAMSKFENYIHTSDDYDDLIKVAILHAEFEAIHPFLDGNGRLGRMFIPLYLHDKQLLPCPSFYMSSYFEKHRMRYYDLLLNVSKTSDWLSWCEFFISGIIEQAKDNYKRAKKILDLYRKLQEQIPRLTRSPYAITALDFIFKHSYFSSTRFFNEAEIPKVTARRLTTRFEKAGILLCIQGTGSAPNFYVSKELIDIADGR